MGLVSPGSYDFDTFTISGCQHVLGLSVNETRALFRYEMLFFGNLMF